MSNILEPKLKIHSILPESIVDGEGVRLVVFTQGCKLRCPMCHNPETHALDKGEEIELAKLQSMWQKNPILSGITISGGEPFLQPKAVLNLVKRAKDDHMHVIVYSGYTFEALRKRACPDTDEILKTADVLIDGPFIYQLKDLSLLWKGSKNQRVIDLQQTHQQNEIVTIA